MIFLAFALFIILALLGMPLAMAMTLSSITFLYFGAGMPLSIMAQQMFAGIDSFPLMAIPFFVLAGELMNSGGLTKRLVDFGNTLVGHQQGALGRIAIVSSVFFGAISGSAVAGASALGGVLLPAMEREKYPPAFAAALIAVASSLAPIIPPSISMVMYGIVTGTSIEKLFLGGAVPGLIYGAFMLVFTASLAKKRKLPYHARTKARNMGSHLIRVIAALFLPVIIFGGILSGVFTVTESAAVAAIYALLVGIFIYKELASPRKIIQSFQASALMVAVVMFLIGSARLYGILLALYDVPAQTASIMLSLSENKYLIFFLLNIAFLLIGMFLETNSAIVIFIPIFFPLIQSLGIDPVHFGVVVVFNLALGLTTPPFGLCISLTSKMAKVPLKDGVRESLPYTLIGILVLFLITYFPSMILFLPRLMTS